jgi:hypothetical protein
MSRPRDWEEQEDGTFIDENGSRFDTNGKYIPYTTADVEHPGSRKSGETKEQYRIRVDKAVEKGFHLGDLSWGEWREYCEGSPGYTPPDPEPEREDHDYLYYED